ncbi:putative transcriptional regulator YvhJ [compost metagenome]
MQHLDGNTALQYVRFRHDKMSDFSRTSRQRELLKAIAEKMQTTTSIAKLPSILEQVNPFIDTNLSVNDMWKLASVGYESKFGGSEQIPPMNMLKEERINGAAVLTVGREDKLKEYIQEFLNSTPEEETPEQDDTGTGTGTDSKSPPPTSPRESASEPSSGSSSSRASVSDIN